jgi:hypothetical protein
MTTYLEALAPYTQAQQMKLVFAVLSAINEYDGPAFNMIADGSVDEWEGEPRSIEEIIDNAQEVWAQVARNDDTMHGRGMVCAD